MYSSCYISLTKFILGKLVGSFLFAAVWNFRTEFVLLMNFRTGNCNVYFSWRCWGPVVSTLDSRSFTPGSSMGWGHHVLFFLFLFFYRFFPLGVTLWSIQFRGDRNTPSQPMFLIKLQPDGPATWLQHSPNVHFMISKGGWVQKGHMSFIVIRVPPVACFMSLLWN